MGQILSTISSYPIKVSSEPEKATPPQLRRFDANDPKTNASEIISAINHDGGVIIENLITTQLASRIKSELKPHFDTDSVDLSGFFPATTQRASGLINISPGCRELATVPLWIEVANGILTDRFSYWHNQTLIECETKPVISSTVGFRVNPGGKQQALHRDDTDYHNTDMEKPVMVGCVTAITKTTKENGGTVAIPGSHKWGPERCPYEHETTAAELEPGSAMVFLGNMYHAGGGNTTTNEVRETVGMFFSRSMYRQAENQYLMVPPGVAKEFTPQIQRLLGYGISLPSLGFYQYQDPMKVLFGVEDEETVVM
ncbi:hypothetical protein BP5796_08317 [Coleophoma crateriformis]|uniref:Phytanoyl-dioxygenase family protein n=1 Tax=Coleophoma crateriformis TaxID=565419 RepID=A0A3D8R7K3_9HELO|nr:hypothetical protein BP5796_08317 [Coleophoma crateriformis]